MNWSPGGERLDQEIFDAVTEFIALLMRRGEQLAESFDVPVYCIKAMHRIETSVPMRDLGQSMKCDPSFVTMIADALESRGLARREPNPTDRRIKNLVLTDHGLELKATLEQHLLDAVPWVHVLDTDERKQLLELIRKMNSTMAARA